MKFKEIVGQYSNKLQAFSYPSEYAMIRLVWQDLGENKLHSQSFYEFDFIPDSKPYRESYHTFEEINDNEVVFNTYTMNWELLCIHNICWDGEFWVYQPCDDCIVDGIRVISQIKFNKQKYYGRDAGYNQDGKLIWGKETGMFEFDKISHEE